MRTFLALTEKMRRTFLTFKVEDEENITGLDGEDEENIPYLDGEDEENIPGLCVGLVKLGLILGGRAPHPFRLGRETII